LLVTTRTPGVAGKLIIALACLVGLACALPAGIVGLIAAAWNGVTLALAWHRAAPAVGTLALGPAAFYSLAALAGFGGNDPEDVQSVTNTGLAIVALGCAIVGITSALVWIATRSASSNDVAHDASLRRDVR
jgi:hypothetical protein